MFWVLFLVLACAAAGVSCARLCLAAARSADTARAADDAGRTHQLSLYETAFLSGGPGRVADVTLVSMARGRRLLLAHTGWATVIDPRGRDAMERGVLVAIGPQGQTRIAPLRAAAAAGEAVRALAERLVTAGLAVPETARTTVADAVRQVRMAAASVVVLGALSELTPWGTSAPGSQVMAWFALPLLLTLGCLAIARIEVHPYTRWASPLGQRVLAGLPKGSDELLAVAVRGVRAVGDPQVRAALAEGRRAGGAGVG
ncbi:TIGR04222 domain-containing membrane protein [Streptomyces beihaiensis]|uniref:TIGR04222 domain-containing membrane protein n=1 Tax=Streptomyces beihaiensis TaxID=2984495 RepID=A0ABT3TWH0_9ACTN|nr:TIGR04222 domain-containing membrane protein [Streptomyces beihaiensis]MCX3061398.1 TIGR04222 domain-containing membrane protein [Streptomyces beihaiensis]